METSIASRIRIALFGLAIGISVAAAGLSLLLLYSTEDLVFIRQLLAERESLESTAVQDRYAWTPGNRSIDVYWARDSLPEKLRAVTGSRNDIYEYFDGQNAYFVLKGVLADAEETFFLTYDVSGLLAVRVMRPALLVAFGVGTLVFVLGAMAVALLLSRKTLAPLRRLTKVLQSGEHGDLKPGFAEQFGDDEVGVLAGALDRALQQVAASARREFEFNRGVSHELRTPIHVAKNAVELMEIALKDRNDVDVTRPLERLARATEQTGYISEAFLWLASDSTVQGFASTAAETAERLLEDHDHLLAKHATKIRMDTDDVEYQVPLPVLLIVVGNLLRNAIQHSDGAEIVCRFRTDRIVINDSGTVAGTNVNNRGFGIGLEIVERICQRLDWQLLLETRTNGGMRASIIIAAG